MKQLKTYGRPTAFVLIGLGCLSLFSAFFLANTPVVGQVWAGAEERMVQIAIDSPIAANWLLKAGIRLYPQDGIFFSGLEISPSFRMPTDTGLILVYRPAVEVTLKFGSEEHLFYSSAPNLGEALWEQGIVVNSGDKLTLPLETALVEPLQVVIDRGEPLEILVDDKVVQVVTSASTVSAALVDAGITLQGLDFSIPDDSQSLPDNREIEVVRVREMALLEDTEIPFTNERIPDDVMPVGEQKILQTGQNGIQTSVVRVRYENDIEISRTDEWDWISRLPLAQQTAYGTKIVIGKSPDGMVDYWLSREVKIVSYRDTGQPTATGIWPYYGVIAVSPEWFSILRGSSIYVPGYGVGTVLDVCPGCSGKNMIDVFIPIDDYVPWNRTDTVYFMPPIPPGFSGDLP